MTRQNPVRWYSARTDRIHPVSSRASGFIERINGYRQRLMLDQPLLPEIDLLAETAPRKWNAPQPDWLARAFAVVDRAVFLTLNLRFHDVQFLGGLALVNRTIAEMETGEGKTLTAALPAFVFALIEPNVHVMTSNSYLAHRDAKWLEPLFNQLGLTVGLLQPGDSSDDRRKAYDCDIVYGAGDEFVFDYLRDQIHERDQAPERLGQHFLALLRGATNARARQLQRGLATAIVDEIDHVLIDNACSALIISGGQDTDATDSAVWQHAARCADDLRVSRDYVSVSSDSRIVLTDPGRSILDRYFAEIPQQQLLYPWQHYVVQSLRARDHLHAGTHYVIHEDGIRFVDQGTGRILKNHRWQDGLHQAIEARESLRITGETPPLGRMTRQRFHRLYSRLCGMTGTARESESEFRDFYGLSVVPIPTWRPNRRSVLPTRVFSSSDLRWKAIEEEILMRHRVGQPVLVGTRTISASEELAERLQRRRLPFQLLNGLQDANEAAIIERAGDFGAITVATNMAGRGTDIRLGDGVASTGGLHVIGSEHHFARRIDRQLIGRTARQGQRGSARFFASADDELFQRHAPEISDLIRRSTNDGSEMERLLAKPILQVQKRLEKNAWKKRRALVRSDRNQTQWLQKQFNQKTGVRS